MAFELQENHWISKVKVLGLHNRINFEVNLQPGINVIYGKNGLGKTTLLHILANLSEIDIDRFVGLKFKSILVVDNRGGQVRLEKSVEGLALFINDQRSSYINSNNDLSDVERESIREIAGERATYLPAFRSVLERMRESPYSPYDDRSSTEYDNLRKSESLAMRFARGEERSLRRDNAIVESNVYKTMRCRQWFGSFVPAIRYPSITDVTQGLNDEWASAQLAASRSDQKQFETAFVEIFLAVADGDVGSTSEDQGELLNEIRELVSLEDNISHGPHRISPFQQLIDIAEKTGRGDRNYIKILEIYRNKLSERKAEREKVLNPLYAFQASVNVFLTGKSFKIGFRSESKQRRPMSSVFIEAGEKTTYGVTALSSGERQIVTMLYSTSRSPFKAGCCLIDEPELSLHIDWQRIIIGHIAKQHQGRQIIACTHSPEVGADHSDRVQFFLPEDIDEEEAEVDTEEGIDL